MKKGGKEQNANKTAMTTGVPSKRKGTSRREHEAPAARLKKIFDKKYLEQKRRTQWTKRARTKCQREAYYIRKSAL